MKGRLAETVIRIVMSGVLGACGYQAVYGGEASLRLTVVLKRSLIPDAIASDEVVSGVREELAASGALASGAGYPRVEVEVLRADEMSDGIVAVAVPVVTATASSSRSPRARATETGLVARACLVRKPNGPCERDTGDVRAMDLVASDLSNNVPNVQADAFHHRDALRDVGKRLGARLADHILGQPTVTDESIGREH